MAHVVAYCVADITGEMTSSQHWNVQRDQENRYFVHDLPKGVASIRLVGHAQWILRFNLYSLIFRHFVQGVTGLLTLGPRFADSRVTQLYGKDSWASLPISKDQETGKGFSNNEFIPEVRLFTIGGTDGMITVLTATLFYSVHSPDKLRGVTSEMRNIYNESMYVHDQWHDSTQCPIRFGT
ncbi:hypothetical protein F5Y19DRAFT_469736 [Xylariaceae sp. FL1651]|nr:hypothetical protein F5Y19DRAFT_469736 [Xylariaceae sp. FL1651]